MQQAIKKNEVNIAYHWFLGLDILDPVLRFFNCGKNYIHRFKDTDLFGQIFSKIQENFMRLYWTDTEQFFVNSIYVKPVQTVRI